MAYRLIIKFPFQSVNDEQYVLAMYAGPSGAFTAAKDFMDADNRCFKYVNGYNASDESGDWVDEYEGTLTGSVTAEDDKRKDLFDPLCPSKLKFSIACQQFPAWLMDLCGYATNVRVVLYASTGLAINPLRVRWRGYLQCSTLNMTVVNDLLSCPLVAIDEIGVAKYMPFRANCAGRPAYLTLYGLIKKWWGMNWTDRFYIVYKDLLLPTNQAALYWHRNASIVDDDGNEVTDLLNTLCINLERYYLDRDATWETVLSEMCQYLSVHFCIGGYSGNYSYDNYVLASYDSGTFYNYVYGLQTNSVSSSQVSRYSELGNQAKVGADLQVTYDPAKWKGSKVMSTPTRPPIHEYLNKKNTKPITPASGHGEYVQTRIGKMSDGVLAESLKYWRLIYTQIVNEEDQWTDEADYIVMEDCNVSSEGRTVGGGGYFPMTDAPLGRNRPDGNDTDSLEFIREKNGLIPIRLGCFESNAAEWRYSMVDYLMLLNNMWGRLYWNNDEPLVQNVQTPFKVAEIKPFGLDASVVSAGKSYISIDFKALFMNENIGKGDGIFEQIIGTNTYTNNLYGRNSVAFPTTETYHEYSELGHETITGRLEESGQYHIYSTYPFIQGRLRIGNWFYDFDLGLGTAQWNYYADPSDAPLSKFPLIGNLDKKWIMASGLPVGLITNYYYSELSPKAKSIEDSAFIVPLENISTHAHPLQGNVVLEIWWPVPFMNAYLGNNQKVYNNNILGVLINDINIKFTDDAEMNGEEVITSEEMVVDAGSETKEMKEVNLALSTPKVDGTFMNCLLYDGGKAWHNLQAIQYQGGGDTTPEAYLSTMIAAVYSGPVTWVEFNREFEAADYGNIANMDFRVSMLTEAAGLFVPVNRKFDFTKGWVRWKLQKISNGSID